MAQEIMGVVRGNVKKSPKKGTQIFSVEDQHGEMHDCFLSPEREVKGLKNGDKVKMTGNYASFFVNEVVKVA